MKVDAGIAEIAMQRRVEPVSVADVDGLIEPIESAHLRHRLRRERWVAFEHVLHRIAGHQPDQHEEQQRHHENDEHGLEKARYRVSRTSAQSLKWQADNCVGRPGAGRSSGLVSRQMACARGPGVCERRSRREEQAARASRLSGSAPSFGTSLPMRGGRWRAEPACRDDSGYRRDRRAMRLPSAAQDKARRPGLLSAGRHQDHG